MITFLNVSNDNGNCNTTLILESNGNGYSNNVNGNCYSGPDYLKSSNKVIIK